MPVSGMGAKQEKDGHPGDGHVEPQGERDLRDLPVTFETPSQREIESGEDQGHSVMGGCRDLSNGH